MREILADIRFYARELLRLLAFILLGALAVAAFAAAVGMVRA